ncbi:MAG: hypothetical protein ACYCYP_06005 [Leptospirales bacterium]
MNTKITGIVAKIAEMERELEIELEREAEEKRQDFHSRIEQKQITFERDNEKLQKEMRQGILDYLRDTPLRFILVAPLMYSFIIPLWFLDGWIWLYQIVCFKAFGIAKVDRSNYVILDRGHLPYLNWVEQTNCNFCGYANGLIAYGREIAARTEQFFCPIKHAQQRFGVHSRYQSFFNFGDAERYKEGLEKLREDLKP